MSSVLTCLTGDQPNVNTDDMSPDKPYHHGDLARSLEEAAFGVVETDGASAVSLRGLARDIGVDPAATYRHFKSKEALLIRVAARGFNEMGLAMLDAMEGSPDARGRLVDVGMAYVSYGVAHPQLFALMFTLAGQMPRPTLQDQVNVNPYTIFVDCLTAVLPDAADAERDAAIAHLWCNVHGAVGLINQGLMASDHAEPLSFARNMCERVVATLAPM